MQSSGPIAPEALDLPDPGRAAGAGARRGSAGQAGHHHAARGALVPAVPLRRLQRPAAARRAHPRREAVGAGDRRGDPRRTRLRTAAAARDRAAQRRPDRRGGDLVRSPLRRAPAVGGGRDHGPRQGHAARLADAVHLPGVLAGRARVDPHRAGGADLPAHRRRDPEAPPRAAGADPRSARCPVIDDPLRDDERAGLPPWPTRCAPRTSPRTRATSPPALDRLAFDELLALQLTLAQARQARSGATAPSIGSPTRSTRRSSMRCRSS